MMFWVFLLAYLVAGVLVQPVYAAIVRKVYEIQKKHTDPVDRMLYDVKKPNYSLVLVLMVEAGLLWPIALPMALLALLAYWIMSKAAPVDDEY